MKTFKALLFYEAQNALKMVAWFYGALFGSMAVMILAVRIATGLEVFTSVPGFDFLAMVLGSVMGAVAMSENYRYFKQNGLTRRMILAGDLCGFAFAATLVGLVGACAPMVVRRVIPGYLSALMQVYGSEISPFASWALLTFSFFLLASVAYFIGALMLRLGKRRALALGIVVFCVVMVVLPVIFTFEGPALLLGRVIDTCIACLGFSAGAAPVIWPAVATTAVLSLVATLLDYLVLRRFEWRW